MTIPVWFQDWYNNGSGGIAAAAQTYIDRVEADGGAVESIGCVPSAVWDWTAPIFTGFLDGDTSAIFAASSVRLLTSFTSDVTTIRRTTGSPSEGDFAFVNSIFDQAGIESFCAATDGFIAEIIDQMLTTDISQTVASRQPQLVTSGAIDKIGGVPFYSFSTDDVLTNVVEVSSFLPAADCSIDIDFETGASVSTRQTLLINRDGSNNALGLLIIGGNLRFESLVSNNYPVDSGGSIPLAINTRYKMTLVFSSGAVSAAYVNGVSVSVTSITGAFLGNAAQGIQIGGHIANTSNAFDGKVSTVIMYDEVKDLAHNQAFNAYDSAL